MNETITITADNRELTFQGEPIDRATSHVSITERDERTFAISLYAVTGGGFTVVVEFRSSNQDIRDNVVVEQLDTAEEVEAVLAIFEPLENLQTEVDRSERAELLKRVRRGVMDSYYKSADQICMAAKSYLAEHPDCEVLPPVKPAATTNRVWKFLGLGVSRG